MKKLLLSFLLLVLFPVASLFAQRQVFQDNGRLTGYKGEAPLQYSLDLHKGRTYQVTVYQQHIDVAVLLFNANGEKLAATDLADGNNGYDKLEYTADRDGRYTLTIQPVSGTPVDSGNIRITVRSVGKVEMERRKAISRALEAENRKDITTIDIRHFWEAYDALATCTSYQDSVAVIQSMYLDRATDGLKAFQRARDFSAEFFVERIRKYKHYYTSVRNNTTVLLQADVLSGALHSLRQLYPGGKPARICLAIGPMSTGGTISDNYLLIGIEMLAGDKDCVVTEISNENLKAGILSRASQTDVINTIKETVVHEYIHTQQKDMQREAVVCPLLTQVIREGIAAYISEKLVMKREHTDDSPAALYAHAHEKELWEELKSQLCTKALGNWLFNAGTSKDRPGDLGYRIGYHIAEAYYEQAVDKQKAVQAMIEIENPLLFLDQSKYDLKFR